MRATSASLPENKVKLSVELDDTEMNAAIDKAVVTVGRQVNIKGFRKGKVPRNVLVAHLGGPAALRGEAIRESMPDFYAHAVVEAGIDPIGQPDIEITGGEDEGNLSFECTVEVRPEVKVSGYQKLRVTLPSPLVTPDEVDAQINRYLETDAVLKDVERPIVTGDMVTMDVKAEQVGVEGVEPFDVSDFMYAVGSNSLAPETDGLIVGMKAGEELRFTSSQPGGLQVAYVIQLKAVKERELPKLDDEWVKENTEWASVEEMRTTIQDQMQRMRVMEAQMGKRDAISSAIAELVAENECPASLLDGETNERLHDLGHRLSSQNFTIETFLQATGQSAEQLIEVFRTDALRAVRSDLALRAIVKAEKLEASDEESEEELVKTALSMNVKADVLRENLYDSGRQVSFQAEVAKVKAQKWLEERVVYVDPEGVEINKELLEADQNVGVDL
jgi:trigger factor